MTRIVAMRRAGYFRRSGQLVENAGRKNSNHVSLQMWIAKSVNCLASSLAIALWLMVMATTVGALERDYSSADEQRLDRAAQLLAEQGKDAFNSGKYAEAVRDYSRLLRLKPQDSRVFFNRGLARKKLNDLTGALDDFREALALNSDLYEALVNRAHIYLRQGREADAVADLERAEVLRPRDATVLYYRGTAYSQVGELRKAIAYFTKTLELNAQYAPAFAERGQAFLRDGKIEAAKTDFARALELDPTSHGARAALESLNK